MRLRVLQSFYRPFCSSAGAPVAAATASNFMEMEKRVAEVQSELKELYQAARYTEALDLATSFSSHVEEHFGEDHPVSASFYNNRALMHRSMGQYEDAMPLYERALRAYEKVVGKEHPSTTTCLSNMSYLCKTLATSGSVGGVEKLAMLERAREYGEQALENKKALSMPEHPDVAIAAYNLGAVLVEMRSFERAKVHLDDALALLRKRFGDQDHRLTAAALNNVAVCLKREAEHSMKPSSPVDEAVGASSARSAAEELDVRASAVTTLNAARTAHDEALGMRTRLLGDAHPDTLASRHNVAELCETLSVTVVDSVERDQHASEAHAIRLGILETLEADEVAQKEET